MLVNLVIAIDSSGSSLTTEFDLSLSFRAIESAFSVIPCRTTNLRKPKSIAKPTPRSFCTD
jgi:hypothetical protein